MEGLSEHHESPDHVDPRIYVASLSDYNNGHLHGRWIAAAQAPERIYEEIHQMLATSPTLGAEEWAIHDYEGFAPHEICETEDISTISQIAAEIAQHRSAQDHTITTKGGVFASVTSRERTLLAGRSTISGISTIYPGTCSIGSKLEINDTLDLGKPYKGACADI